MYRKSEFGRELELEIIKHFKITNISRWAYLKYLDRCSDLENGLKDVIMSIVMMEEGPEFEYTKDELLKIAKNLQEEKI